MGEVCDGGGSEGGGSAMVRVRAEGGSVCYGYAVVRVEVFGLKLELPGQSECVQKIRGVPSTNSASSWA